MSNRPPYLSLVLPVYRGADFIADNVVRIIDALESLPSFELLVVCDGCEESARAVRSVLDPRVRVLYYAHNEGKGYAVCYGLAQARGRLAGWLDADLDIEPDVVVEACRRFEAGSIDVVVGSKRHPDSIVHYPWQRRVLSWGFQKLVKRLFRFEVRDPQVGMKIFRRELLDTVLPLLLIKRYAFDVEILAVAADFGFDRVEEVPVRLDYRFSGTGIDSSAVQLMFRDTMAIAYRIHLRHWYVRQYAALQRQRGDLLDQYGADGLKQLAPPPSTTLASVRANSGDGVTTLSVTPRAASRSN
jgi:glycosyltransferase involved in cell wall biosynthesis